jgi:predicted nuclease of restriction endonuclease-like (RecB) superfamily
MKEEKIAIIAGSDYEKFLTNLKARIQQARISAAHSINRELILLYWDVGKGIVEKQQELGWGEAVVESVSADLQREFPHLTGLSPRNLRDMKRLYLTYTDEAIWRQAVAKLAEKNLTEFLRQLVAKIPWGHNILILNMLTDPGARLYYLRASARYGWSRNVLLNQIKAGAYERAVTEKKTHNFPLALPEYLAEQADEAMKSSYNLEFLGVRREIKERELEDKLIERLREFILELGYGFCFIGRQHRLTLGEKEYFIDLLFYHRFLKALVAFELKVGPFEPEYAGKMDFYLNLLNEKERSPEDHPSIGIILCAKKDNLEVEFALKSKINPIGVAEYYLQTKLPSEFKGKLPTARQLTEGIRSVLPGRSKDKI